MPPSNIAGSAEMIVPTKKGLAKHSLGVSRGFKCFDELPPGELTVQPVQISTKLYWSWLLSLSGMSCALLPETPCLSSGLSDYDRIYWDCISHLVPPGTHLLCLL
jgi:hypothetical protein